MQQRLGFIGFGEAGYHFALGYQTIGVPAEQMVVFYPFVDVAIFSAVPATQHRTHLLAAGDGVEELASILIPLGTPIQVLGTKTGMAANFKMLRSVFSKGLALLLLETLVR